MPVSHATVYLNNLLIELFEKKTKGKDCRKNPLIEADAWSACGGARTTLPQKGKRANPPTADKNGAGNGIRTRDTKLGKLVLCQLSYARL